MRTLLISICFASLGCSGSVDGPPTGAGVPGRAAPGTGGAYPPGVSGGAGAVDGNANQGPVPGVNDAQGVPSVDGAEASPNAVVPALVASPAGPECETGRYVNRACANTDVPGVDDEDGVGDLFGEAGCGTSVGPGQLRRLTPREHIFSLEGLFGAKLPPELGGSPLSSNSVEFALSTLSEGLSIVGNNAKDVFLRAESVADWAVQNHRQSIAKCAQPTDTCRRQVVKDFGRRAFRQPLDSELEERYLGIFRAAGSFEEGLKSVVSTMIQSPYFLYRREIGSGAEQAALSTHELASSLSYLLTGSAPDTQLAQAADQGDLSDAVWSAQVARLLESPAAEHQMVEFIGEWLELHKIFSVDKNEDGVNITPEIRQAMWDEAAHTIGQIYQSGSFRDLFASTTTFMSGELARHYGEAGLQLPEKQFMPVDVTNTQRARGILGGGAFLVSHSANEYSSPTRRGYILRKRLLCLEVHPPPAGVSLLLPQNPETNRQRFEVHAQAGICGDCHLRFEPLGMLFEAYDGNGRYRPMDNGYVVDATGSTPGMIAGETQVSGINGLNDRLADDEQVRYCFVKNYSEFAFGQSNWDQGCSHRAIADVAQDNQGTLKSYIRALVSLPHFRARLAQQ